MEAIHVLHGPEAHADLVHLIESAHRGVPTAVS